MNTPPAPRPPLVGAFLVARLVALAERLRDASARVLSPAPDEEAVHDLRVAMRRIRTVLEVGQDVLGRYQAGEVRRALRDVHRATGSLRDAEVLRELIASLGAREPDAVAWLEVRRRQERRLRGQLLRLLRAGELDRGQLLLAALLAFRVKPSRDRRVDRLAPRAVARARRAVARRRGAALDDASALHDLRIAWKRLRYTVDTFSEVLPPEVAATARGAARMQSRLGDLHDLDVAVQCVRRARTLGDAARAELLGALARRRDEAVASYVREVGVQAVSAGDQAEGTDSLRKISTR